MKRTAAIALLLAPVAAAHAQAPDDSAPPQSSISVNSTLVLVPALVRTKSGELVFTLKANDFLLTDDGIPQPLRLEEDTGDQPLALVICVETGSDAATHLDNYRSLGTMLDALIGNVPHQVAVVGFDSTPTLLHGFTPNTDYIAHSLDDPRPRRQGRRHPRRPRLLRRPPPQAAADLPPRHPAALRDHRPRQPHLARRGPARHRRHQHHHLQRGLLQHPRPDRQGNSANSTPPNPARSTAASPATSAPTPTATRSSPKRAAPSRTTTASPSCCRRCAWPAWPRSPP
jgi:hypothetical protein